MRYLLALSAAFGLAAATNTSARAQAPSSAGPPSSQTFNPFATFSLNRFSFNTLGFLQVGPTNPFAVTTSTSTSTSDDDDGGEVILPQSVVVRPPFRPPVRSPYRPPPRPPF
jgi:hypothetical protein